MPTIRKTRDQRPVFVRFVCYQTVEGQRFQLGLFQAREYARHSEVSEPWALKLLSDVSDWFECNLDAPDQFRTGKYRGDGNPAICWYKPTAVEHIRRMHEMKVALEACGVHVDILTTKDVGQILYEDSHQVAAVPTAKTFA